MGRLRPEEKQAIVQGSVATLQAGLAAPSLSVLAPGVISVAPFVLPLIVALPIVAGLTATLFRQRFPTGGTEEQLFGPIRELAKRGLRGRISSNPFTGRPVISAFDQDPHLFGLLERRAQTAAVAPFLPAFSEQLGREREALISGLEETRIARGFARSLSDLPERGGVFRRTAESPLEFVAGDFLS